MDALRDPSWMRELYTSSPAERFERGRFTVVSVTARPTPLHQFERYRYRMFFFEPGVGRPVMSADLESDILGAWRLTVTTASGSSIAMSFDEAPDYETFKAAALSYADAAAERARAGTAAGRSTKERATAKRGPRRA
ncbi:MAG TPA: hypothetical protein PLI66_01215 [Spirochaetales bacterium]|nr:hypothetical protein [Spirochaetales bacterium]